MDNNKNYNVIVVGGGAAGMMAALSAAELGAATTLIEKNEKLGKKVFITGKGRCNVTNAGDTNDFFDNVLSNPKFLYSSVYGFDAFSVMELIERYGCKLKIERGNRVFPESDHSWDIINAFENGLIQNKVNILKNTRVSNLIINEADGIRYIRGVELDDKTKLYANKVIVATGGKSYASTGSDGNFFKILEKHSVNITSMSPGLVPLVSSDLVCKKLMGLSLKNVSLDLYIDKKKIYSGFGEMLFTHFGISGPLVLTASSIYSRKYNKMKAKAVIDLKPALSVEKLEARLLREFEENKNKDIIKVIENLVPRSLAPIICERSCIDIHKKVNIITSKERLDIINTLKSFTIDIVSTRDFDEAIITLGGISVKEINPSTMESKNIEGLYFAGEMIDVDATTGGYNLQIAWSTGRLAGISSIEN